jgi:heme-degrading monooxygenase HmoA
MHARIFTFRLGPGSRDKATDIADRAYALTKTLKGFVSATYLIYDGTEGDYGSITVWENEADAYAAGEVLGQAFGSGYPDPPGLRIAEVYERR